MFLFLKNLLYTNHAHNKLPMVLAVAMANASTPILAKLLTISLFAPTDTPRKNSNKTIITLITELTCLICVDLRVRYPTNTPAKMKEKIDIIINNW